MSNQNLAFKCSSLGHSYPLGKELNPVLKELALEVSLGEFVCLSGPSGSGKTTLLNIMGLIETPQKGDVQLLDLPLNHMKESQKTQIRLFKLGFVFQQFFLFPTLTAQENVEYFLLRQKKEPKLRAHLVEQALCDVGLWEHRHKKPSEMSGGQQQRVSIARALAKKPQVLIADEPTASLDRSTGRSIMEVLSQLNGKENLTIVVASHDSMVSEIAKRNIKLLDGRIVS
jgi:putative ABC transport system ATP-binding protein